MILRLLLTMDVFDLDKPLCLGINSKIQFPHPRSSNDEIMTMTVLSSFHRTECGSGTDPEKWGEAGLHNLVSKGILISPYFDMSFASYAIVLE